MISIESAYNSGAPLLVIESQDPQQTINTIINEFGDDADGKTIVRWDIIRTLAGLNEKGSKFVASLDPTQIIRLSECLGQLSNLEKDAEGIVFLLNAHRYWNDPDVVQGIWNLRDNLKPKGATLIMLTNDAKSLPDELKSDVVILTDTLPTPKEVEKLVDSIFEDAGVKKFGNKNKVIDLLMGVPAFGAETALSMNINGGKVDLVGLREGKRRMIEQTPGLSVWRGAESFKDIGGYRNATSFLMDVINGRDAPKAILFLDEVEKMFAGTAGDNTGVSQDFLGAFLSWSQKRGMLGVIFIGGPGTGKTLVATATGNEAGIETIVGDIGAMKTSALGSSEQRFRTMLNVVDAVAQGTVLCIATCNSIQSLPPEFRRRFKLGTFFFPFPSKEDRKTIWEIYLKKFKLVAQPIPDDDGWTGAEISNCAEIAYRLNRSLVEAAKFVVPVSIAAADQMDRLCREAHNRYVSASYSGVYKYPKMEANAIAETGTPVRRTIRS